VSCRDDLCDALRRHYMKIANEQMVFYPEMLEAIEAYRREPQPCHTARTDRALQEGEVSARP
jgi:hypothetical protein